MWSAMPDKMGIYRVGLPENILNRTEVNHTDVKDENPNLIYTLVAVEHYHIQERRYGKNVYYPKNCRRARKSPREETTLL